MEGTLKQSKKLEIYSKTWKIPGILLLCRSGNPLFISILTTVYYVHGLPFSCMPFHT